jgi:putative transposase
MRLRIRDTIEELVKEELDAALGAPKSARVGAQRRGYRHGTRARTLTTSLGPATFAMPRARIQQADGTCAEWSSATVGRYERRTTRVDEAILGVYLAGGNTRRIKNALSPLLKGCTAQKNVSAARVTPLSQS